MSHRAEVPPPLCCLVAPLRLLTIPDAPPSTNGSTWLQTDFGLAAAGFDIAAKEEREGGRGQRTETEPSAASHSPLRGGAAH